MFFGVLICFTLCRFATTQQVLCYQSPRVKSSKPISYKHASCHVSLGGWCGWITSCIGGNDLNTVMCNGQPNVAHQQEVWYLTGNTYTDTIQYNLYIVLKYHQIANRHKLPGWKIKKTSLKSICSVTLQMQNATESVRSKIPQQLAHYTPGQLTWQWKNNHLNHLKMYHVSPTKNGHVQASHVSFRGG